jgi:hypothetical protein
MESLLHSHENLSDSKSKKGNRKVDPAKMVFKKGLSLVITLQYVIKHDLELAPFLCE